MLPMLPDNAVDLLQSELFQALLSVPGSGPVSKARSPAFGGTSPAGSGADTARPRLQSGAF